MLPNTVIIKQNSIQSCLRDAFLDPLQVLVHSGVDRGEVGVPAGQSRGERHDSDLEVAQLAPHVHGRVDQRAAAVALAGVLLGRPVRAQLRPLDRADVGGHALDARGVVPHRHHRVLEASGAAQVGGVRLAPAAHRQLLLGQVPALEVPLERQTNGLDVICNGGVSGGDSRKPTHLKNQSSA
jgi:hypothetical protein